MSSADRGIRLRREVAAFVEEARRAVRQLATQRRGLAATAILTLGLGIGATTAILSVVRTTLLAPLPLPSPDRLLAVRHSIDGEETGGNPLRLADLATGLRGFARVAGTYGEAAVYVRSGEPTRVRALRVYGDFLDTVGLDPILGRDFREDERRPDSPVALVTERFWRRELGADPGVLGRSLALSGRSVAIVGILPDVVASLFGADVVVPGTEVGNRKAGFLDVVARLDRDMSTAAARARFRDVGRRMAAAQASTDRGLAIDVRPFAEAITGVPAKGSLLLVLATALFVLLIVCVNIACLLLARAPERQREGRIRAALGASSWALVRGALAESLVLAAFGGALGAVVAAAGIPLLLRLLPASLPRLAEVRLDLPTLALAAVFAGVSGLAFGLLPALSVARRAAALGLRAAGRATEARDRRRVRAALVVIELAVSLVLSIGAGLTAQTLARLRAEPLGFRPEQLVALELALPWDTEGARLEDFYQRALAALEEVPGVRAAAFVDRLPLEGESQGAELAIPGRDLGTERVVVSRRAISAGYFQTLGAPIEGRPLDARSAGREVLVNRAFAHRFLGGDAIGREIVLDGRVRYRIAGVVPDLRQQMRQAAPVAEVFTLYQDTFWPIARFVVRTSGDPATVAASLRGAIRRVDPLQVVDQVGTIESALERTLSAPRLTARLVGGLALVALLLAAIGLYGVLASDLAARRREFGIRLALGASPQSIVRTAQMRALALALAGIAIGLGGGVALRAAMASVLYGSGAADLASFAIAAGALLLVAILAADAPARRAAAVDPVVTLRAE